MFIDFCQHYKNREMHNVAVFEIFEADNKDWLEWAKLRDGMQNSAFKFLIFGSKSEKYNTEATDAFISLTILNSIYLENRAQNASLQYQKGGILDLILMFLNQTKQAQ